MCYFKMQLNPCCWKIFKKFLFTSEVEKGREIKQLSRTIQQYLTLLLSVLYDLSNYVRLIMWVRLGDIKLSYSIRVDWPKWEPELK